MDVLEIFKKNKLIPVVVLNKTEDATPMMKALLDGGIKIAEICFRTECAAECIKLVANAFPNILVGAGTVINAKQCKDAISCGAKFIVSPGLSEDVASICKENNIPYIPGVITPTEIIKALEIGLTTLKFFPAGEFGGLKTIKSLASAFPSVKFMPTGGVNNENLFEFLSFDKIIAVGGSWLVKGNLDEVVDTCKKAISIVDEL